ncbi:MAG: HAD family hydrolase [Kiritimatiellae bacterium]|nr:HAD family hydrolase [Kiritimatiellia bacterium]
MGNTSSSAIGCAIFDLDGTLYPTDAVYESSMLALCLEAERLLGIPRAEMRAEMERAGRAQWEADHRTAGYHSRLVRCQLILEGRGLPLRHAVALNATYWDAYMAAIRPFPDAAATLSALKARGIRVGLGTNMTSDMQYRKLETLGLIDYFDFIVTSEEAGIEKPDPAFFAACVAKARCPASRCLFVGDDPARDAAGAIAAGLRAVWVQPDPVRRAARSDLPAASSLSEILPVAFGGI